MAAEALLDGKAQALTRKAIEAGLAGDMVALRLCLERILPARRSRIVRVDLPRLASAADALAAVAAITEAVAVGEISPDEGVELTRIVEGFIKVAEISDMERRLRALEEASR